ncbi:hypothetical protein D3C84_439320 [compost metagenome]
MSTLEPVEELRLYNLKLLHGTGVNFGAPTSGGFSSYLASKKVHISQPELSNIYHRRKPIDFFMAQRIEKGLDLPDGWLSQDQSFWLSVNPQDILVMQAFMSLPGEVKEHVAAIIQSLSKANAQQ